MSRTKRDILDTETMLQRLTKLLAQYSSSALAIVHPDQFALTARADAESLRRISMTLHRWHELECGDSNDRGSWCLTRGHKVTSGNGAGSFQHADDGASYIEYHSALGKQPTRYTKIPDREAGALKRLAAIMARYPSLTSYVQGDPRGCALYILRPGDVPEGEKAESYYSCGLAVHQ